MERIQRRMKHISLEEPWNKVRKIGVAFECQKLDSVITDQYDIKLDMIITENNTYLR